MLHVTSPPVFDTNFFAYVTFMLFSMFLEGFSPYPVVSVGCGHTHYIYRTSTIQKRTCAQVPVDFNRCLRSSDICVRSEGVVTGHMLRMYSAIKNRCLSDIRVTIFCVSSSCRVEKQIICVVYLFIRMNQHVRVGILDCR
jgi:hypothetical protein